MKSYKLKQQVGGWVVYHWRDGGWRPVFKADRSRICKRFILQQTTDGLEYGLEPNFNG